MDTLIIGTAWTAIAIAGFVMVASGGTLATVGVIVLITGSFLLIWGYYMFFETIMKGRTPGKASLKIRVLTTEGYPIGFPQAAIRNLVRIVDFLPVLYGVGIVTMFISKHARRLGDFAAGTVVIKERPPIALERAAATAPARSTGMDPPERGAVNPEEHAWNLRALNADEVQLARQFLARAPALPDEARRRLGDQIARRVASSIGSSEPLNAVQYLERVLYLRDVDSQ